MWIVIGQEQNHVTEAHLTNQRKSYDWVKSKLLYSINSINYTASEVRSHEQTLLLREFTFRITFIKSLFHGGLPNLNMHPLFTTNDNQSVETKVQANQKIASILVKSALPGLSRFTGGSPILFRNDKVFDHGTIFLRPNSLFRWKIQNEPRKIKLWRTFRQFQCFRRQSRTNAITVLIGPMDLEVGHLTLIVRNNPEKERAST